MRLVGGASFARSRSFGGASTARSSQHFSTWLNAFRKGLSTRPAQEAPASVSDEDLARLANRPLHPLRLADLVQYGRPPLSEKSLYSVANSVMNILPTRLAHRIQAFRSLPFIVVTNPAIRTIHDNYVHSLAACIPYIDKKIQTKEDAQGVLQAMEGLLQRHSNTIPLVARGFLEVKDYVGPETVTKFLDEHLRARIGTRLIAEQHIALHYASQPEAGNDKSSSNIGVIDTQLQPSEVIRNCEEFVAEMVELKYGVRPYIIIDGEPDTQIAYIPTHLEYILTELIKNSFRAVAEQGNEKEPIIVTIAPSPEYPSDKPLRNEDQGETSAATGSAAGLESVAPGVTIRIRDRGGGISPEHYANLWSYGFTTFSNSEASDAVSSMSDPYSVIAGAGPGGSLAGLGYGLPLGRAYAEYFGGGIAVQSLYGWGTDAYLTLRGVGKS